MSNEAALLAFVIRRLLQSILVMLAVGFIAFSLFNFVGDPVALMLMNEACLLKYGCAPKILRWDRDSHGYVTVPARNYNGGSVPHV